MPFRDSWIWKLWLPLLVFQLAREHRLQPCHQLQQEPFSQEALTSTLMQLKLPHNLKSTRSQRRQESGAQYVMRFGYARMWLLLEPQDARKVVIDEEGGGMVQPL